MNNLSSGTLLSIALSEDEAAALAALIRNKLGDLAGEVYKTEDYDYRTELKQHEALLRAILAKLPASA